MQNCSFFHCSATLQMSSLGMTSPRTSVHLMKPILTYKSFHLCSPRMLCHAFPSPVVFIPSSLFLKLLGFPGLWFTHLTVKNSQLSCVMLSYPFLTILRSNSISGHPIAVKLGGFEASICTVYLDGLDAPLKSGSYVLSLILMRSPSLIYEHSNTTWWVCVCVCVKLQVLFVKCFTLLKNKEIYPIQLFEQHAYKQHRWRY